MKKERYSKDAIIFSYYIKFVSTPSFHPTHLRAVKNIYFANRFCGVDPTEHYIEQRFGPYNPKSTYAGAESVATSKKYIQRIKGGFKPGSNNSEISNYQYKELQAVDKAVSLLKYKKDTELEFLATVDFVLYKKLKDKEKPTSQTVFNYIQQSDSWSQKIDRLRLSIEKISEAMTTLRELAKNGLPYPALS